jgi:membrane protein
MSDAPADHAQRSPEGAPSGEERPPESPTELPKRSWWVVLRRSMKEFTDDNLSDAAAALTYYATLSIFPALLVLVSLLGLAGPDTAQKLVDNLGDVVPGSTRQIISSAIMSLQQSSGAGLTAIVGILFAIWSASGYVGAFMRAANTVFDVPEGRPVWKTIPVRLGITVVLLVLMSISAIIVVFTGPLARQAGDLLGLGSAAVTAWGIAKWPILLVILMFLVAILYWAAPNAKQPGFRWITPGGVVGVLLWLIASVGFAFYVANFSNYNKTYGALAGVIVFLVWMWISNLAILLGAELNAELDRARAETEGLPEGEEPYLELRDTKKA